MTILEELVEFWERNGESLRPSVKHKDSSRTFGQLDRLFDKARNVTGHIPSSPNPEKA